MSEGNDGAAGPGRHDIEDLDKLVGAVARGEDGAFDLVFAQLSYPVFCMALSVVRNQAQAEEITQDVLMEIWRTAGRYDPARSAALAWALMITRRRAIDRVRSRTADTRRERQNVADTVPWDQTSNAAEEMSDREQLRRGLSGLSTHQLEAIALAFYGGYTHTDIAAILNLPVGTVKGRIRAALAKLRDAMRTDG